MTYGTVTGVAAINAHKDGGYTASSVPTEAQVDGFLDAGASVLDTLLNSWNYATPVASRAGCYAAIARLNNLYAAACAEEATNVTTLGVDGETRSERLWDRFENELERLKACDLSLAGLSRLNTTRARARVRSVELRRRDGYAHQFDSDNTEYASQSADSVAITGHEWIVRKYGGGA